MTVAAPPRPGPTVPAVRALLARRDVGATIAVGVALGSGLAFAAAMPRGPITTAGALAGMAVGAVVGAVAGYASRSRWALLVVPVLHVVVFEIGRVHAEGPTVDAPSFDTSYGVLAFLLGRGFHALVVLLPMVVGAVYGVALARRGEPPRGRRLARVLRRAVAGTTALLLVVLAVLIARPASTPPIDVAGSVASLERVEIGGVEQWLLVRGESADSPVLLYLSGGPGQTDMPQVRLWWRDLEDDFVVVNWDERGVGKSYASIGEGVTLEGAVADTVELAEYLRERFDERKIYLVGESWGTMLGVLAVRERPDLFHAYVGSGQMVDVQETDRLLYDELLAYAERTGDDGAAAKLRAYGTPPYDDVFANAYVMTYYDELAEEYEFLDYVEGRYEEDPYGPWGTFGSEYTLVDRVNVLRGLVDYFAAMYPQIQDVDLRRDATELAVPVYLVQGRHELDARTSLVTQWVGQLDAPTKELVWFERAGHATAFEDFRRFERLLTGTVLPATYGQP